MSSDALFRSIERHEQETKTWGRVLDAGTGEHSLSWLLSHQDKITHITAVTGDELYAKQLQKKFHSQLRPQDTIIVGNWNDEHFCANLTFDLILADYLLGAMDGFAPYFQTRMLPRLLHGSLLRPGGKFYLIGLEPFPTYDSSPVGKLMSNIAQTRDACIQLAGHRCYREYPQDWVLHELQTTVGSSTFQITASSQFPNRYTRETCIRQVQVARQKLALFSNARLAQSMTLYLNELELEVHRVFPTSQSSATFGFDYLIGGHTFENHSRKLEN